MENKDSKWIYVLYHANCFDGTGAKYAAWKRFGDAAYYIPVQYGKPFPDMVKLGQETDVYILDFSYPRDFLEDLHSKVHKLVVLDHHKTAQADLAGLDYAEFDMNKSGAVLAWEYFHPGKVVPDMLRLIQDGDLWKFEFSETKALRAALPLLESNMIDWDLCCNDQEILNEVIRSGEAIERYNAIKVDNTVQNNVKVLPYKGYKAGVLNTTTLVSEIGNAIYDTLKVDFSMSYFFDIDGVPVVSFRSKGDMDVSAFAKELGGGGHKNAAGAKVDLEFIRKLYAEEL